jgi:hypothetical protein
MTPATYRLIAGAVKDAGIQVEGETIPIHPDNREKIAAVVDATRRQAKPAPEAAAQDANCGVGGECSAQPASSRRRRR